MNVTKKGILGYLDKKLADKVDDSKIRQIITHQFLEGFLEQTKSSLEQGEEVKLSNFGNFTLLNKAARPGRNPKTGDVVIIKPRRVVVFKPSSTLKKRINQG